LNRSLVFTLNRRVSSLKVICESISTFIQKINGGGYNNRSYQRSKNSHPNIEDSSSEKSFASEVQSEHNDFSKMNYLKSKKIEQENEEDKMMKKYKEELDGPKEDKTIKEESSVDSDQEDSFYIKVNYFLQRENNVRLFNQFPLDNLNDPASTDRNTVNAKQIGIYSKCISAIKDLPKSAKRNVILADYKKIVNKYSNLANKILNS
jgi:hypothetical protein